MARALRPTKAKAPVKLDRRFRLGRRVTERERFFIDALGGETALTPVMRQRVAVAAELAVAAEMARDRFLKGEGITADDLVRLSNQAARAERALRIPDKPAEAPPSLRGYLGGRAAA